MTDDHVRTQVSPAPRQGQRIVQWLLVFLFFGVILMVPVALADLAPLPALAILFAIFAVFYGIFWFLDHTKQRQKETQSHPAAELVERLLPGLDPVPDLAPRQPTALMLPVWIALAALLIVHWFIMGILILVGMVLLQSALEVVLPALAFSQSQAVALAVPIIGMIPLALGYTLVQCGGMIRRYRTRSENRWDPDRLLPLLGRIVQQFLIQTATLLALILLIGGLNTVFHSLLLSFLLAGAVVVKVSNALYVLAIAIPLVWIFRPARHLDYDTALQRARRFKDFLRLYESYFLSEIGASDQARTALFDAIQHMRARNRVNLFDTSQLAAVGNVALNLGNYADAIAAYEVVDRLVPTDPDTKIMLATAYLLSGTEFLRPVELTQASLKRHRQFRPLTQLADIYTASELLATHAWALAASGQPDPARAAAAQALEKLDHLAPRQAAEVHLRVGYALWVCGDVQAHEHFRRAAEIDGRGWAGRTARAALAG